MARLADELMKREDEVIELKKQLHLKTTEATSHEERKQQLEQELTHMTDSTAVMAERTEIEKEKQEMEAERRHYKRLEAQCVSQQGEMEQLKQKLLRDEVGEQGKDTVTGLKRKLEEKETKIGEQEMKIEGLLQKSKDKSVIVGESHQALQNTSEAFQNTIKKKDHHIEEQSLEIREMRKQHEVSIIIIIIMLFVYIISVSFFYYCFM